MTYAGHSIAVPRILHFQTIEEISIFVTAAVCLKRPISASYHNRRRLFCPHIIGRNKEGSLHVLCYQYGGESASGLKPPGSTDNWRCIALSKLGSVQLLDEPWQSTDNHLRPQTCISEVLFDAEKLEVFAAAR